MAFDFSKFNFLKRLDARARIFVVAGGVVGLLFMVYVGTRFFSSEDRGTGGSRVAGAPDLVSVPGSQVTPEYYRTIQQANEQAKKQAQISGGSTVPIITNVPGQQPTSFGTQPCVICTEDFVTVKARLEQWLKQGKIQPDVAAALGQMADKLLPVAEFSLQLDDYIKQGKITPEQARQLLNDYSKQYANARLRRLMELIDQFIKAGLLPLDVANSLVAGIKSGISPTDYAILLQGYVDQGKITQDTAKRLLADYTQMREQEVGSENIAALQRMARDGEITAQMANELAGLIKQGVSYDSYENAINKALADGKITPAVAKKLLEAYQRQKSAGPLSAVNDLVKLAEQSYRDKLKALVSANKISPDAAALLQKLADEDVSIDKYRAALDDLVAKKIISPETAKELLAEYTRLKGLRDLAKRLQAMQAANASLNDVIEELKRAVQAGLLTPDQAAKLLEYYQAGTAQPPKQTTGARTDMFAKLNETLKEDQKTATTPAVNFNTPPANNEELLRQQQAEQQARAAAINAMANAMAGQAQQLISAWQPVVMQHKEGSPPSTKSSSSNKADNAENNGSNGSNNGGNAGSSNALIKAGSILFAVLDTEVNSDYPDSPVMATIVSGPFKGAKLLGKLTTNKSVAGQLDRVSLNFTLMNEDAWPASKAVTAFAIDPDKARTVLASHVDYHYMKRFGAIMATSFLQGYGNAVQSSASTTTTGIFGTSTTNPQLSPGQKLATALGQIGQTMGKITQGYANIPPTVKVDSGVGLGILFMADVK